MPELISSACRYFPMAYISVEGTQCCLCILWYYILLVLERYVVVFVSK